MSQNQLNIPKKLKHSPKKSTQKHPSMELVKKFMKRLLSSLPMCELVGSVEKHINEKQASEYLHRFINDLNVCSSRRVSQKKYPHQPKRTKQQSNNDNNKQKWILKEPKSVQAQVCPYGQCPANNETGSSLYIFQSEQQAK